MMDLSAAFTVTEILSLLGLIQSVYILVYMLLRSGNWKYSIIPVLYFLTLAMAFLMDAAASRWEGQMSGYGLCGWAFWITGIPMGTLLIMQVAKSPQLPGWRAWLLLILIPVSFTPLKMIEPDEHLVYVAGLIAGAICLLIVLCRRELWPSYLSRDQFGRERFWLILALLATSTAFLFSTLAYVNAWIVQPDWIVIRNILGIGFAYIAATSLFRIYPQAIILNRRQDMPPSALSEQDKNLLSRVESLIGSEKVYQQASYGRVEMARELGVGEAVLSKAINAHFGKTIPQLLNDHRVLDAQALLRETDISITQVFEESGFNSLTTFNRVFKDLVGISPSEYRNQFRNS